MDTKVPVMAAVGKNKKTGGFSLGFGCHLVPELAAKRALTELCQLIPIRDQSTVDFNFNDIKDDDFLYPLGEAAPFEIDFFDQKNNFRDIIFSVVNILRDLGLEVLVFDYSKSYLPIKTVRVFCPGLCHIWPQFGNSRLYEVPVKLGFSVERKREEDLNQQALYI